MRTSFVLSLIFSVAVSSAEDSAVFEAIDLIVDEIKVDVKKLAGQVNKSAIIDISQNEDISTPVKEYLINKFESIGESENGISFVHCHSCFVVRAESSGTKVFLRKGVTQKKDLLEVANELDVDSYSRISFIRQRFSLRVQLNIYNVSDDQLVWSQTYVKRTMSLGDRGMTFSFGIEQGMGSVGSAPTGGMINLSERIHGVGDFGVSIVSFSGGGVTRNFSGFGPNFGFFLNDWEWGRLNFDLGLLYGSYGGKRNLAVKTGLRANFGTLYYMSVGVLTGVQNLEEPERNTVNANGEAINESLQALPILAFGLNLF